MRKLLPGVLLAMTLLALSSTAASGAFPVLRIAVEPAAGPVATLPSVLPAPAATEQR